MSFGGKQSGSEMDMVQGVNRNSDFSYKKNSFDGGLRSSQHSINQESTHAATKDLTFDIESRTQTTVNDYGPPESNIDDLQSDFADIKIRRPTLNIVTA